LVDFGTLILYVAFIALGLFRIGLWDKSMIKDTVYWTFGVGFIIMMNFDKALKEEPILRTLLKKILKSL